MFFLIRSAFWLTVAFLVIHPSDANLQGSAAALGGQIADAGKQLVVAQVFKAGCLQPSCAAGAGLAQKSSSGSERPRTLNPTPLPRPRPDGAG